MIKLSKFTTQAHPEVEYLHISKNYSKLIIVFQGHIMDIDESSKRYYNGEKIQDELKSRIVFYKYFKELNLKADLLFIMDNNSEIGTWYYSNNKRRNDYNVFQLIEEISLKFNYKPQNIYSFGSSKGGFASLYFGLKSDYIQNIYTVVPQIKAYSYLKNKGDGIWYKEFRNYDNELIDQSLFIRGLKNKKIKFYTSIGDLDWVNQDKLIEHLSEEIEIEKYIIQDKEYKHAKALEYHLKVITDTIKEDVNKCRQYLYINRECNKNLLKENETCINDYSILKNFDNKYRYDKIYFYLDDFNININDLIQNNSYLLAYDIRFYHIKEQDNYYGVEFKKVPKCFIKEEEKDYYYIEQINDIKGNEIVTKINTNISKVDFKSIDLEAIDSFKTDNIYAVSIITNQGLEESINTKVFVMYYDETYKRVRLDNANPQSIIHIDSNYPYFRIAFKNENNKSAKITNFSLIKKRKEEVFITNNIPKLEDLEILNEPLTNDEEMTMNNYLNLHLKGLKNYNRTECLNIRSLKLYNKKKSKLDFKKRLKLVEFCILLMNNDIENKILDEIIFLKLGNIFYDSEKDEVKKSIIIDNFINNAMTTFLSKDLHYYNHDYIFGLNLLSNIEFLELKEKDFTDFLKEICRFMIVIGLTPDGNGVENTCDYTKIIANFVKKKDDHFGVSDKLLNSVYKNLEKFKLNDNEYIPFGDYNSVSKNEINMKETRISLKDSGYYIYRKNFSIFILKTKLISDAHSHLDMGSFVYYYNKSPIFVELGLYKYDERDDERIFVRSLQAHNLMTTTNNIFVLDYIRENSKKYHKYFDIPDRMIKILEDNWEESLELKTTYNWIENNEIFRAYKIKDENSFVITNKSDKNIDVISHFNLDYRFRDAKIIHKGNTIVIEGEKLNILLKTDNFQKYEIKQVKQWENMNEFESTNQLKIYHKLLSCEENNISIEIKEKINE